MVGGSTGLNGMAWDRASKAEYDAWGSLLDSGGWSYSSLLPSFLSTETKQLGSDPFPIWSKIKAVFNGGSGTSGPVQVCYSLGLGHHFLTRSWDC